LQEDAWLEFSLLSFRFKGGRHYASVDECQAMRGVKTRVASHRPAEVKVGDRSVKNTV
jgi:hypothetical protein